MTRSPPPRANCFDASALIKVFSNETGSEVLRDYWNNRSPTKYTTPFCIYEALSVLKVKWLYREELTKEQYLDATFQILAWFGMTTLHGENLDLHNPIVLIKVQDLAKKYSIDISDAFQVLSVKEGYFSALINDSQTILVTADKKLARAARAEGIKAWYCLTEEEP